jgi:glycosyltransferase involved in cell wall biosynthesis
MRIAEIVCSYPPYKGGIGKVAERFAELLAERGHKIIVFTLDSPEVTRESGSKDSIQVKRLNPIIRYGLGALEPRFFYDLNFFDAVIFHYPFYGANEVLWLGKTILRWKIPLAVHYHMDVAQNNLAGSVLSLPSRLTRKGLFRRADLVTCASLDYLMQSFLKPLYLNDPDKFLEIPFGVDLSFFKPGKTQCKTKPSVLFVGGLDRAHYFKGVDLLLRAFSRVKSEFNNLVIVGEGDMKTDYQKLAARLNISNQVVFYGSVPDDELVCIYQESDIFVLPSINRNEAFGLVLLEAMASGVPVIASDLPGVRKVFKEGEQGLLIKPGSVSSIENKLLYLAKNPGICKKMGLSGRRLVKWKYDWQVLGDRLEKSIFTIIADK